MQLILNYCPKNRRSVTGFLWKTALYMYPGEPMCLFESHPGSGGTKAAEWMAGAGAGMEGAD